MGTPKVDAYHLPTKQDRKSDVAGAMRQPTPKGCSIVATSGPFAFGDAGLRKKGRV